MKLLTTRVARQSKKFSGGFDVCGPESVIVENVIDLCAIMNDRVDRFRQLLPGTVREPEPRARQVAAHDAYPGFERFRGARVVKACLLQARFQPFARRRWLGRSHQRCKGRTRLVEQAAKQERP